MNTVKRRWPDLLIGLLVLLLLAGFAALLLGKNRPGGSQAGVVQSADSGSQNGASQTTQPDNTQSAGTPSANTQSASNQGATSTAPADTGGTSTTGIPTIPAAPVTNSSDAATPSGGAATTDAQPTQPDNTQSTGTQATSPAATPQATTEPAPQSGGAVATSENRTPTRNDYRISLGSYADSAALQATTAGVAKLGYTVYPIAVASGVVAQVGPFASREAAAQALADIQRALPRALLYPPRNAPASSTSGTASAATVPTTSTSGTSSASAAPPTSATTPAASLSGRAPTGAELAATGPVYLQVGAYNSTAAAQTAVARVRDLGLEPSVNAPTGRLVTVVVGPFEGQALTAAEAKLQSGGIESFRVR